MKAIKNDTKKVFKKLGTCSRTYFYLLNREFGYQKETEELAADVFAGGIMKEGHQCGLLTGSTLAVGAEAFRRKNDRSIAIGLAITATQHLTKSFSNRANSINCRDITHTDLTSKLGLVKLILFKARTCMRLAENWTLEAIQSATEGLSDEQTELNQLPISCASEVANKMGATDEEMVMVAGLAGGLGLSGNACGALSAAIWMNTLDYCRNHIGKPAYPNPKATNTLKVFKQATDAEFLCSKITGKCFKTIDDHTEFIKNGGCNNLINVLAQS